MTRLNAEQLLIELNTAIRDSEQPAPCEEYADLFFSDDVPVGGHNLTLSYQQRARTMEAKIVCHTCPFIKACLAYALEAKEQYGVWGGMDSNERHGLLKNR